MPETVLSLVGALAAICVVLALSYLFTRYVVGRTGLPRGLRGRHITILEQVPVGRDQRVLLVQVGEQCYLLGAAQGGVAVLDKLSAEEAEALRALSAPAGQGEKMGFQEALKKVLEQRSRQRRS